MAKDSGGSKLGRQAREDVLRLTNPDDEIGTELTEGLTEVVKSLGEKLVTLGNGVG